VGASWRASSAPEAPAPRAANCTRTAWCAASAAEGRRESGLSSCAAPRQALPTRAHPQTHPQPRPALQAWAAAALGAVALLAVAAAAAPARAAALGGGAPLLAGGGARRLLAPAPAANASAGGGAPFLAGYGEPFLDAGVCQRYVRRGFVDAAPGNAGEPDLLAACRAIEGGAVSATVPVFVQRAVRAPPAQTRARAPAEPRPRPES
jgi:hypothetical protein